MDSEVPLPRTRLPLVWAGKLVHGSRALVCELWTSWGEQGLQATLPRTWRRGPRVPALRSRACGLLCRPSGPQALGLCRRGWADRSPDRGPRGSRARGLRGHVPGTPSSEPASRHPLRRRSSPRTSSTMPTANPASDSAQSWSLRSLYHPEVRTHPQMALTAEMRTDGGCVS